MTRILQPITLPPGFSKLSTALLQEGRWVDGDKVRSVGGVIETMGGWAKRTTTGGANLQMTGLCRGVKIWRSLDDVKNMAFGTHRRLYVLVGGTLTNITPVRDSGNLGSNPFTTVSGSAVVTVADTAHGVVVDAYVTFASSDVVGGLDMDAEWEVSGVVDANTYEITHTSNASSSATGGGTDPPTYSYEINPGQADTIDALGYGIGGYGQSFYGTPRTSSSVLLKARTWDLDTSGEDLIATHRNGSIYLYDYSAGGVAALLSNAPTDNKGAFVAAERHVVAYGAGSDPLRVKWSDIDDITIWAAAAANQAGDFNLIGGSEIISGRVLRAGYNVIWTDTSIFRMLYLGRDPFFTFRKEASGVGLIGPHAHMEIDGIAYWLSDGTFHLYDGFVREMPNFDDIRHFMFKRSGDGIDRRQRDKVFAFRSTQYREIWWLYQSVGSASGDVDRYIMHNIDEATWYSGSMARTAWDEATIYDDPIAVDPDGYIYDQETGEDDDGAALSKTIRSSTFDLGNGERHMEIMGFLPDFDDQVGDITITFYTKDHSNETERTEGPYTITTASDVVDTRAAGRQTAFQLGSNVAGGRFRLGAPRMELEPSGQRR